jgi:hypothetical protein
MEDSDIGGRGDILIELYVSPDLLKEYSSAEVMYGTSIHLTEQHRTLNCSKQDG